MARDQALMTDDFVHHVDSQLDEYRSQVERYAPGAKWLDEVVDTIDSSHISDDDLRRMYVAEIVRKREGEATRSVTNMARKMAETGQMPIDWFQYADRPIAYTEEIPDDDGNLKSHKVRVTLRSATGEDFEAWANWREAQAKKTLSVEMQTVRVFRGWAHEMELGGFRHFKEYAEAVTFPEDELRAIRNA